MFDEDYLLQMTMWAMLPVQMTAPIRCICQHGNLNDCYHPCQSTLMIIIPSVKAVQLVNYH